MSFQNCHVETRPIGDYRKQETDRGELGHVISSSTLRTFAECPSRWFDGYEAPDSDAKRWGTLLDCFVMTPKDFPKRFVEQPSHYTDKEGEQKPWRNDKRIKAVADWLEKNEGKETISANERFDLGMARDCLLADETIKAWLDSCDTQVWVKGEWADADGLVVPVQCLIDFVPRKDSEFAKCLGDLKTTRNASQRAWARWCWQAGYHIQAAWNIDLYCAASGEDRNTFCFILSENYPPWQPAKRMLSQDFLIIGRNQYQIMMANYCHCLRTNRWPDYDEGDNSVQGWGLVQPENWMQQQAILSDRYHTGEEPPETSQPVGDYRPEDLPYPGVPADLIP